jgi:hypothetical protein
MPAFSISPAGPFPPPESQDFPRGIQFQLEGVDVGGRNIDTINFVPGAVLDVTVGVGEDSNVLTITIPSGSGVGGGGS